MVLINAGNRASLGQQRRHQRRRVQDREKLGALTLSFIAVGYLTFTIYTSTKILYTGTGSSGSGSGTAGKAIRREDQQGYFDQQHHVVDADHPALHLDNPSFGENSDFMDAIATDILQTLQCNTLLAGHARIYKNGAAIFGTEEKTAVPADQESGVTAQRRRRLEQQQQQQAEELTDDAESERGGFGANMDDDNFSTPAMITGAHLFCLAALPQMTGIPDDKDEMVFWKDKAHCDVRGNKQRAILDLWSTARAEIPDDNILLKTLQFAVEQAITLVGKEFYVWAAPIDAGTSFMTNDLNEQAKRQAKGEYGGVAGLADNLGFGKLYVDIGSGLGYTAMAVAILYPGTEIISVEAAPTNWLLQEMNWRCNDLFDQQQQHKHGNTHVLLAGVGSSTDTSQLAKFLWRPTATTSTRAWSLSLEEKEAGSIKGADDLEVSVKLRPWHWIQSEADIKGRVIDVLNVDCEGCEYNLIPALAATDFESIRAIMGQVHWGYIPRFKLPSTKRGQETHERLCRHENLVRSSIECCAFPRLTVRSSFSGEVLVVDSEQFPPVEITVKDLAGELCDNFAAWAVDHNLFNVESDWAWFQHGSMRANQ